VSLATLDSSSDQHYLALASNGMVFGWGDNSSGQSNIPAGLNGIMEVALGQEHSLALDVNGQIYGWGTNGSGQTAFPSGVSGFVQIASASNWGMALRNGGTVTAWGLGTTGSLMVPDGLEGVIGIAAGDFHGLAIINAQPPPFAMIRTGSQLPSGKETIPYSKTLSAWGGTSPYTWSVISGNLPSGIALDTTAGVISGTPNVAGTYEFTVLVGGNDGSSSTRDFSLVVSPAPAIFTSSSLAVGTRGISYNRSLTATGGLAPYTWAMDSGSLPSGLSLSASGVISGTPTALGNFGFTVRVIDNEGAFSTKEFTLAILDPEIEVEQPAGTSLADGGTLNFGSVAVGSGNQLTFTIKNSGGGDLAGLAITKDGADAAEFSVGSLGLTYLAPGAITTFTVAFAPGELGDRTATLQLSSNDSDENPFDIMLTGNGSPVGVFDYYASGNAITITNYTGPDGEVSIPSLLNGLPVTGIGTHAFQSIVGITSVVIPASVIDIGNGAFNFCTGLTSVTIAEGVETIGDSAFANCGELTEVVIPASVTSIGDTPFSNCSSLQSISVDPENAQYSSNGGVLFDKEQTLLIQFPCGLAGNYVVPQGVTTIGRLAFDNCSVTDVSIAESVSEIGIAAFYACDSLVSVSIGAGVTTISIYAFYGCISLTSVSFPGGLESIQSNAFQSCWSLEEIIFPTSVSSIGDSAFASCMYLERARFLGDAPTLGSAVFDYANPVFKVLIFDGASGFTLPEWNGYPVEVIYEEVESFAEWLLLHGLPSGAEGSEDLNGDGVSLLMAYALKLDPNQNLAASMPRAVVGPTHMTMMFQATSPGITYIVQTSTDLRTWTTDGVLLSPLDHNGNRYAAVARSSPQRFLRLVVENQL